MSLGIALIIFGIIVTLSSSYCFFESYELKDFEKKEEEKELKRIEESKEKAYKDSVKSVRKQAEWIKSTAMENRDFYIKNSLNKIADLLNSICDNTSQEEFKNGNFVRLSEHILPQFTSIVKKYFKLNQMNNNVVDIKTKEKLKKVIIESEEVFENILKEAMRDDIIDANVEMKVFQQYTDTYAQNKNSISVQ